MAVPCVVGLVDLFLKQNVSFFVRSAFQARQLVTSTSVCQAVKRPTKPPGPFFRFLSAKRTEILSNNPGMSAVDVSRIGGKMWREMDQREKETFVDKSKADLDQYHQRLKEYKKHLSPEDREEVLAQKRHKTEQKRIRRKKNKDKEILEKKPVGLRSSFALFVKSSKLQRGDLTATQFLKNCSDNWVMMSADEKQIYVNDAHLDAERYRKEMAQYENMLAKIGREDLMRKKTVKKSSPKSTKSKSS